MDGFIARVLSFTRGLVSGDVKVFPGGGAVVTLGHFGPPGDDSPPLPTDKAVGVPVDGTGVSVAVGYVDTLAPGIAKAGEKRLVGRNAAGVVVAQIFVRADGSILIANNSSTAFLDAGGVWTINGAQITLTGDVITAGGVSLDNHMHLPGTYTAPSGGGPVTGNSGTGI